MWKTENDHEHDDDWRVSSTKRIIINVSLRPKLRIYIWVSNFLKDTIIICTFMFAFPSTRKVVVKKNQNGLKKITSKKSKGD